MSPRSRLCIFSLVLVLLAVVGPIGAWSQLPQMELRVSSIDGTPEINPDTGSAWVSLGSGRNLRPGDRIRTGEDETVELEVPAVTYSRVTESSLIEVKELSRTEEERGLLTTENVVVNNIELREIRGKVQNSVRQHEGVATDYKLETPNAIAGVRGTDFQCEVTDFGQTNCAVLEGEVQFSSRENPERSVSLGAGQQSRIGEDETRPSDPTEISPETRRELEESQQQARTALQLPPVLSSFELNGTGFQNSVSLAYSEQATLTLSGEASAPEDGADLTRVQARVNGEDRSVEGLAEWALTLEPEVPSAGEQRTVTVELRARDTNENESEVKTLKITLVNESESGEGETEGLPSGYEEGQVDVELTALAGQSPDNVEFPVHVYRPDVSEGGLSFQGQASGDASVENVAYSLDGGESWRRASGAENWSIDVSPENAGEFTLRVRAWTVDGIIGSPVEIGPVHYHPISYEQAMRETFDAFWTAFEREDPQETVQYLHPDFQFQPPDAQQTRIETLDRSGFQDFLREEFNNFLSLRVFYSIGSIFGNPQGGTLRADKVEWKTRFSDEQLDRYFPGVVAGDGTFKYRRTPTGQFRILSFEDFNPEPFIGFDNIVINDTDGYFSGPQEAVFSNDGLSGTELQGQLIAGLENGRTHWPGDPPKFYVNPSPEYDQPLSFCAGSCSGAIVDGGIYRTPHSSFEQVDRIAKVTSDKYKNQVELQTGRIYAVNLKGFSASTSQTSISEAYLLEVEEMRDTDGNSFVDQVRIRIIKSGGGSARVFNGANPFQ